MAAAIVIWALGLSGPVQACLACIAMPDESLADKAAQADAVALLRPDPDDPFRFAVVGWVKGEPVTDPVPFLVSRARAAEMADAPEDVIVATWTDGAGWAMHDLGSPALPAVLADVLSRDLASPEARSAFFAPLVGSHDPAVARMAMVELATLPYAVLRNSGARMDRAFVARAVADPLWSEWAPVAILLLGLSDDPADLAFVRRAATLAAQGGRTVNLGAWLTALIETDAELAMDLIRQGYLQDSARTGAELQQVGLALASHAGRNDATGNAILALAGELAVRHPAVAATLAQTMTERGDWSLAASAAQWLESGVVTSPGDAFVLTSYVLAASQAELAP
jgi:hypothetical protein